MTTTQRNLVSFYFFGLLSCAFLLWLFARDMTALYEKGIQANSQPSIPCERILLDYADDRLFQDSNGSFEDWQFCVAENNYLSNSTYTWLFYPIALILVILMVYSRRIDTEVKTRTLLLLFLSPLALLALFGITRTTWQAFFDPENISPQTTVHSIVLVFVFVVIAFIRIIVFLAKNLLSKLARH